MVADILRPITCWLENRRPPIRIQNSAAVLSAVRPPRARSRYLSWRDVRVPSWTTTTTTTITIATAVSSDTVAACS